MSGLPTEVDGGDPHVIHAFLDRLAADLDAGGARALEEYQCAWPGHELLIAREYAAVLSGEHGAASPGETQIGGYRIIEELGRGAQGIVYRATDPRLGRTVALKVLRRAFAGDAHAALRFQREARAASRIDHPGVCTVYDCGFDGGAAYIAMRFVEGQPLAARIASAKHAPRSRAELDAVVRLVEGAGRALQVAHEAGVVHRDLKPGNIVVTPHGSPVLLDFGLAGVAGDPALTASGDVFGTPAYMAPERLGRGAEADVRADVYALGVTLFECLALRRPFDAPTLDALLQAILAGAASDVRDANPAVSRDLAVVTATALSPDPASRYATAQALADDLARVAEGRSSFPITRGRWRGSRPPPRRCARSRSGGDCALWFRRRLALATRRPKRRSKRRRTISWSISTDGRRCAASASVTRALRGAVFRCSSARRCWHRGPASTTFTPG